MDAESTDSVGCFPKQLTAEMGRGAGCRDGGRLRPGKAPWRPADSRTTLGHSCSFRAAAGSSAGLCAGRTDGRTARLEERAPPSCSLPFGLPLWGGATAEAASQGAGSGPGVRRLPDLSPLGRSVPSDPPGPEKPSPEARPERRPPPPALPASPQPPPLSASPGRPGPLGTAPSAAGRAGGSVRATSAPPTAPATARPASQRGSGGGGRSLPDSAQGGGSTWRPRRP